MSGTIGAAMFETIGTMGDNIMMGGRMMMGGGVTINGRTTMDGDVTIDDDGAKATIGNLTVMIGGTTRAIDAELQTTIGLTTEVIGEVLWTICEGTMMIDDAIGNLGTRLAGTTGAMRANCCAGKVLGAMMAMKVDKV